MVDRCDRTGAGVIGRQSCRADEGACRGACSPARRDEFFDREHAAGRPRIAQCRVFARPCGTGVRGDGWRPMGGGRAARGFSQQRAPVCEPKRGARWRPAAAARTLGATRQRMPRARRGGASAQPQTVRPCQRSLLDPTEKTGPERPRKHFERSSHVQRTGHPACRCLPFGRRARPRRRHADVDEPPREPHLGRGLGQRLAFHRRRRTGSEWARPRLVQGGCRQGQGRRAAPRHLRQQFQEKPVFRFPWSGIGGSTGSTPSTSPTNMCPRRPLPRSPEISGCSCACSSATVANASPPG